MLAVSPLTSFRPEALGAELIRLRTNVHLSQRQLARFSGVSNTSISDLESGAAPAPHPNALMKIAQGLATSGSGAIDEAKADEHYLALMRAAGYLPPEEVTADDDELFRAQIAAVVGPDRAPMAELLLKKLRGVEDRNQDTILRVLDALLDTLPKHSFRP